MSDLTDRLLHWSELEDMDSLCTEAADALDAQAKEIEALRAELDLRRKSGSATDRLHNLCESIAADADGSEFSREEWDRIDAENAALRAEVEALRLDAGRWKAVRQHWKSAQLRWRKDASNLLKSVTLTIDFDHRSAKADEIEREIDAAMAAQDHPAK